MKRITFLLVALLLTVSVYSQLSYKINATGQTLSYNEQGEVIENPQPEDQLYGQDANYLRGSEMVFKDNGDGTVSDPNTGLMWQQSPPVEGMTWYEAKEYCENLEFGGYSDWRLPTLKELFSISNFEQGWPYLDTTYFKLSNGYVSKDEQYWADNHYVGETVEGRDDAAFGVNHVTGHIKAYPAGSNMRNRNEGSQDGQRQGPPMGADADGGDQRRPPRRAGDPNEQQDSLMQARHKGMEGNMPPPPQMQGQGRPGDLGLGGGQGAEGQGRPGAPGGILLSSENNQDSLRRQGPPGGGPAMGGESSGRPMGNPMAKQVRAVRGEVYGQNNFVDNGDGTVSDKATGLMWSKDDNGEGIEWVDALTYSQGATLAGYSDWRLPNVKELQSIVDYSRAPSSKGVEAAIDPIFLCTPFVNEAEDDDYGYYWTNTSACFTKGRPFYFAWYVAFGRAVNNQGADFHGAGAVRFDSKSDNGIAVEGGEERYYNFVRLVRDISSK